MQERKRNVVICAAVSAYLANRQHLAEAKPLRAPVMSAWGLSGRQEMMQTTAMLQRRLGRL